MNLLLSFFLNILLVAVVDWLLPGVTIEPLMALIVASLVLGFLNTFIAPVIKLIALPFNLLTLGLVNLVINAGFVLLAAALVDGFTVDGFMWALAFAITMSIVSTVFGWMGK